MTVFVVVVVSVVVVTVYPSASYSIVSVTTSSIISSIVGVQSPTVSVEQSTALLEEDRETDIHSHSHKYKLRKFIVSFSFFNCYFSSF